MNYLIVDETNLEQEHICCAITEKKGEDCVSSKKAWMRERFQDGLVFYRADVRGKAFIEYLPAEKAWCPIEAEGYLYINCFWVSGQLKGQGISRELLKKCREDGESAGKKGLVILSSSKKRPFLSDKKFLLHMGFQVADTTGQDYELMYLPLRPDAAKPCFRDSVKIPMDIGTGFVLYYTNQCPHTAKYAPILLHMMEERQAPCRLVKLESAEQAQQCPAPFTSYSLFYNGEFITNEILSEKKITALLEQKGY